MFGDRTCARTRKCAGSSSVKSTKKAAVMRNKPRGERREKRETNREREKRATQRDAARERMLGAGGGEVGSPTDRT